MTRFRRFTHRRVRLFQASCLAIMCVGWVALAAAQNGALSGRIIDVDGRPLRDATVILDSKGEPARQFKTVSDKYGEWYKAGVHAGIWNVTITKELDYSTNRVTKVRVTGSLPDVEVRAGEKLRLPDIVALTDEARRAGTLAPASQPPAVSPTSNQSTPFGWASDPAYECPSSLIRTWGLSSLPSGIGEPVGVTSGLAPDELVIAGNGVWVTSDFGQSWANIYAENVKSVARSRFAVAIGTDTGAFAYLGPTRNRRWFTVFGASNLACPFVTASEERTDLHAICSTLNGGDARLYGATYEGEAWKGFTRSRAFEPLAKANCLVDDGSAGLRLVTAEGVFVTKDQGNSWSRVR